MDINSLIGLLTSKGRTEAGGRDIAEAKTITLTKEQVMEIARQYNVHLDSEKAERFLNEFEKWKKS